MTQQVLSKGQVSLNGAIYRLGGDQRVHRIVSSQYPEKQVIGDISRDSNPRTSTITWEDWSGGGGLYRTDGKEEELNRFQDSRLETRFKGHLTLPVLSSAAANPSVAGTQDEIAELAGNLYVALNGGTDAYQYSVSGDSWGDNLHDFPAQVTDSLAFTLGGTSYIAFAHTGGYTYTSNGSGWSDIATDTLHIAFWDDRLWGIDNAGQLWFSITIGTEVNDAQLALPAGYVNSLFTGPDADGNEILYAGTEVGLYAHDAANERFVRTGVRFPQDVRAGKGVTWNGDIYVAAGDTSVYRYIPSSGVVLSMGLDRDAGLPTTFRGSIQRLVPAHTGLFAVVNARGTETQVSIWEYNGRGWHFVQNPGTSNIESILVSSANLEYRLYFCRGARLVYLTSLKTGEANPDVDTIIYEPGGSAFFHVTPWFNAGQNDIDKTAIRMRVECTGMSSNETVKVEFALNYASSYESSTITIVADGVTTITFPTIANNNSEAGSDFRAIRFRLSPVRGVTTTNTPNIKSLSLEWRRKIPARYGFTFDINRLRRYGGRSPKQTKASLTTAVESSTQVEFTYVDDVAGVQDYFVDVAQIEDIEETGRREKGVTRVTVFEL
jgi:hypothetical protein